MSRPKGMREQQIQGDIANDDKREAIVKAKIENGDMRK